jgi:hypothetical protein
VVVVVVLLVGVKEEPRFRAKLMQCQRTTNNQLYVQSVKKPGVRTLSLSLAASVPGSVLNNQHPTRKNVKRHMCVV